MAVPADQHRTRIKASIRRGSANAREDMLRLDHAALDELQRLYRAARIDIETRIATAGDALGTLRLTHLDSLLGQIDARLDALSRERDAQLDLFLDGAVGLGVEPFREVLAASALPRLADEALRFSVAFEAEDGLQLSDRLWRLDQGTKATIAEQLRRSIALGHGASEAAAEFLRRGAAVPADVQSQMAQAFAIRAGRVAGDQLMKGPGNPYEQARRLFRTEINRAHGEAFRAAAFEVDDVVGTRFLLSPAHPAADVCDMHAKVNRYGLGEGVYPKGKSPWPAHPNTLSFEEVVFADEVSATDAAGAEDRLTWLRRQPADVQSAVLGGEAKAAALRAGVLRESQINTPWRALRKRYARQGIDVAALEAPGPLAAAPATGAVGAIGIPVSGAFQYQSQKRVIAEALNAIDQVHGDGVLPVIPIKRLSPLSHSLGEYRVWISNDNPMGVWLNASQGNPHPLMTATHEIGHFLDHMGIGEARRFASVYRDPLMDDWLAAIERSKAFVQLRDLLEGPVRRPESYDPVPKAFLRYLLSREELWARSYAQYIALRSAHPGMLAELSVTLRKAGSAPLWMPQQWAPDDFVEIAAAIDALMIKLGWRRG